MDHRTECNYKDKCYRKKYDHFEKFKHAHLEELLERIGIHEIHVPFGYVPNISFSTLKMQLEIERKVRASKRLSDAEPDVKKIRVDHKNEINVGSSPDGDNKASSQSNDDNVSSSNQNSSSYPSESEQSSSRSFTEPGTSSSFLPASSSSQCSSPRSGPSKKTFEKQKVSSQRHSDNMRQANEFRDQVQSQIHMNILDKLKLTSPYNILYTTLESGGNYTPDRLAITFPELLDSPLGLLENSLLINFMVEFGWVLACYFTMGHSNKPITLLYGETDMEFGKKFNKFLTPVKVKPPSSFGSHHTKMMIFRYLDKSIRVVICTANLIESDWVNRTQGVWISEKCEEMLPDENDGESRTNFKKDLLAYLQAYKQAALQPWIQMVQKADMSHINAFFIGSIPGSHKVIDGLWGQARLRSVLKNHAPIVENNSYKVITQISSIGSLGPQPDSWLLGDILTTFASTKSSSTLLSRPSLSVIYPSFANVEHSINGLLGGGCLPYSSITHRKQEWLVNYLHQWKADKIGRTQAVPHIKSYTRVSPDHSHISYFLLTSANLSKAAWGTISKSQTINILSYEAGVLLLPQYILGGGDYFPLNEETNLPDNERKPPFALPYDLPLEPYSCNDIPWFIDNLPS